LRILEIIFTFAQNLYNMNRLKLENREGIVEQIRCYLENNQEAKFIHRLQVLQLFACKEDESCDSLGALFDNSPRSISNWIKKVNQTGDIESLRSKPIEGRPPRLTKKQMAEIQTVLQETPEKWGMEGRHWNGRLLSSHISRRYGIILKVRSCQRLLLKLCQDNRK